jgi:hypothetical protein
MYCLLQYFVGVMLTLNRAFDHFVRFSTAMLISWVFV